MRIDAIREYAVFSLIRQHFGRLLLVTLLHLALFAALLLNVSFLAPHSASSAVRFQTEPVEVIEAVAMELETFERIEREFHTAEQELIAEALQEEEAGLREAERQRQEELRRQQEEQRQREAEEVARQEAILAAEEARQEAQRVAEEARQMAAAERVRIEQERREIEAERARAEAERRAAEADRQAAEEARQAEAAERREREAAEQREREATEQRRAEEEARRREAQARELEDQRRREQMEQEQRRLAAARADREASERRAREDALRQAYISEGQATVERRWRKPEGSRDSDLAVVLVRINPDTGRILGFNVDSCSGSAAFCESVRQTMERLQSLPRPPDAEAVRGGIRIRFSPQSG